MNIQLHNIQWNKGCESDQIKLQALKLLLSNHPKVFFDLFMSNNARLNSPISLKQEMYSQDEIVLKNISLDIWDQLGNIHFNQLYECLSVRNFENIIDSLIFLKRHH